MNQDKTLLFLVIAWAVALALYFGVKWLRDGGMVNDLKQLGRWAALIGIIGAIWIGSFFLILRLLKLVGVTPEDVGVLVIGLTPLYIIGKIYDKRTRPL